MKWDRRFLMLAEHIAKWSKDPSTQVGAVVVGPDREIRATGYNGFPRGVRDDDRLEDRDEKYPIICHAEENAIMNAARIGVSLKGCTLYATMPSCPRCARGIVQVGVVRVVTWNGFNERWRQDQVTADELMAEAQIERSYFTGNVGPHDDA